MIPARYLVILLGCMIGLTPLAIDMYLPSLPTITEELLTSEEAVQSTVSIYLIFFAIPQLFFGPLSDALGRRFAIVCGVVLFLLGSLLCSVAPSIEILLLARALQGIGSAAISVTVPALVKDRFNGEEYTRIVGFIMMVMAIAPLVAPILGGIIFLAGGWRSIFFVQVAVAIVCGLIFFLRVEETHPEAARSPMRLKRLLQNYKTLFSDRHALALGICVGAMVAGLMAFITASPFVYIKHFGVAEAHYGFLFGANVLGMMAITFLNNQLISRFNNDRLLGAAVASVSLASVYLLVISFVPAPTLMMVIIGTLLFIANLGMLTANIQVILLSRFSHMAGATSAMIGALRFGVGSFGGISVSLLHEPSAFPLTIVMAGCGGLVLLAWLAAGRNPGPASRT